MRARRLSRFEPASCSKVHPELAEHHFPPFSLSWRRHGYVFPVTKILPSEDMFMFMSNLQDDIVTKPEHSVNFRFGLTRRLSPFLINMDRSSFVLALLLFSLFTLMLACTLHQVTEGFEQLRISVCVPCVPRHVDSLSDLIGSVRKQTRLPDEFIIALSETSDEEAKKLEEELSNSDFNVIIIPKSTQAFAGENRNRAAAKSTSDLISFIDSDDLMHPRRLEIIEKVYKMYKPKSIVHFFQEEGEVENVIFDQTKVEDGKVLRQANKDKATPHLRQFPKLHHGHITVQRDVFNDIQQSEDMRVGEDSIFLRKILDTYDTPKAMYLVRQPLSVYRQSLSTCPYDSPCWHEAISKWGMQRPDEPAEALPCKAEMIVSFSLWGHGDCYNYGALENALTIPTKYPRAAVHFYVDVDTVQTKILKALSGLAHVRVIPSKGSGKMFWRFKPAFEEVSVPVLIRDTDSLVSDREVSAVQEWIDSDKEFHIMRDANGHGFYILGGMWGARNGVLRPLQDQFRTHTRGVKYGDDQDFLRDQVYPFVKNKAIIHDEIFNYDSNAKKFPIGRGKNHEYVGRIICNSPNAFRFLGETRRELQRDRVEAYSPPHEGSVTKPVGPLTCKT